MKKLGLLLIALLLVVGCNAQKQEEPAAEQPAVEQAQPAADQPVAEPAAEPAAQ